MRESWTDERLDDFAAHVDQRFDAVDRRFDRVEADLRTGFDRIDERFDRIDERFEAMQRLMIQFSGVVVAALIGLIATQL
jgi:tetrahydromethanopterin S-methyltransferase subunit G